MTGGRRLEDVSTGNNYACYAFPKNQNGIYDRVEFLDNNFEAIREIEAIRPVFNVFLNSEHLHKCLSSTSTSLFQIIKLEPNM